MAVSPTLLVLFWVFKMTSATPAWFQNISTSLFNLPGDIKLGGLFPLNRLTSNLSQRTEPDQISCDRINTYGLGMAIAMKYTVDEINANQILLPGIQLGYEIYDTCLQSAIIVRPTLSLLSAKHDNTFSVQCNYTNYETSISAVIGPNNSEMVSVIGKLLGFFLMPQISYGATSEKFSDTALYPSFFRTVPSDKWQVEAMVLLLEEFNWNWVAVVGSDEEYGQRGVQDFSKLAANKSICVAYQGLIPVYTDPEPMVKTILSNINSTKARVVIVFSLSNQAEIFFKEVIRMKLKGVWIGSTSWTINDAVTSLPDIQTGWTILGFVEQTQSVDLLRAYTYALLNKLSEERAHTRSSAQNSNYPSNPCPQCWNLSPANISLVTDLVIQRKAFSVYAAIYSVAQALHNFLQCNSTACKNTSEVKIYPWKLLKTLRHTKVDINGTMLEFDSNGNPNVGYNLIELIWKNSTLEFVEVGSFNKILNINVSLFKWHTETSEVPQSTCSAACGEGQVHRVKGFHSCCFDCIDCLPGTYQAQDGDIQCTPCPPRQWSLARSSRCTDPIYDYLSWDTPEALLLTLAIVLVVLFMGSVVVVFVNHRETVLVTASGGTLSIVVLLGLMGACLSLLLFLGQPGDTVCRLQLPLISAFQTVPLSIIMSISLQIFFVSEFPNLAASYLHVLRGPGTWLLLLTCCAVQAGICGWFVQDGPSLSEYLADRRVDFVRSFLACPVSPLSGFALMQGFSAAMALMSFMCTFMATKPLHQYNLARDITFSSLIYCVIWVTFIPIYIGLEEKRRAIIHVSFILASDLGLVAVYYIPKCYFLLKTPELNTADHFCTFLEGLQPTPAQEEPQTQTESEQ
ncbi:taste receptor, type 1, member 3 precursor [Takifugu rubripes]|uniref:Taste receptor type 1 member 3 n=1 Tax=Takifugu rubripes TaxID=31033 RepID=Q2MHJ8_TAKRU|nr:taste receptor, type 1, member 3 precursor [Takifugu rubripes]BAE78489.1 taste receptor, type 1, member 3 [Takifugu rubripes]|eukprot:NP_001072097.1 taste receptor, type 1, member 3 precursor [Takifugu rubripes]